MTNPLVGRDAGAWWTVEDLAALSHDNGNRYEILDGSLLVNPPPAIPHASAVLRIRRLLEAAAPEHLVAVENVGLLVRARHRRA